STDGGASFRQVPSALPVHSVYPVAAAAPGVWVVGSSEIVAEGHPQAVLLRTADGGRTWKTVHRAEEQSWGELGFSSAQQGVVIGEGNVDRLLMTFDSGQIWDPVAVR